MSLFKSDFLRFFAVGFAAGAVAIFTTFGLGPDRVGPGDTIPTAVAAPIE